MRRHNAYLLIAAAVCLVWSGTSALENYSNARVASKITDDLIRDDERMRATIARAGKVIAAMPQTGTENDSAPTPGTILANAIKSDVKVERISAERGEVRAQMRGSLSGLLEMLDAKTRSATLTPSPSGGEVVLEVTYGAPSDHPVSDDIDAIELMMARMERRISGDSKASHHALAAAFRTDAETYRVHEKGRTVAMSASTHPMEGVERDLFGDISTTAPGLRYLGAITGGPSGRCGVFQDARGLIIRRKPGEEIADWRIVKIEEGSATLSRGEANGISIRLEQRGLN